MKIFQLLAFSFFISTVSFGQGIKFNTTDFNDAMAKAKSENKLIFVDAYTTWCGPCKWMAKNVFTDENVGKYYNESFVNIKIDMEKGEGPELAKKFEITGYPTLIFVNGSGEVIHRSMGSRPAVDFIDLGQAANDPDRQITTMNKRFEAGERDSEFLKKYTDAMTSAGQKGFDEVASLYMATQEDWNSEDNINFLFDYSEASLDSKLFKYTLKNKDAVVAVVGQEKFDQKLSYAADLDRSKAGIARDNVDKLKVHYKKYYSEEKAENMAMVSYFNQLMYSPDPVDQASFKAEIQLFLASNPDLGWSFYNSVAWQIYEITTDQDLLKKAASWAEQSMKDERNSFNTDTKAAILFKLGNKVDAKLLAVESIALAKKEGNDYSATEELLNKIDAK